mgnify:CR=1 FL=1
MRVRVVGCAGKLLLFIQSFNIKSRGRISISYRFEPHERKLVRNGDASPCLLVVPGACWCQSGVGLVRVMRCRREESSA